MVREANAIILEQIPEVESDAVWCSSVQRKRVCIEPDESRTLSFCKNLKKFLANYNAIFP
jgi:hypothetical protein